jgi:hypothetical protein
MNRGSTTSKDNDDQNDHHEIKEPKTGKYQCHSWHLVMAAGRAVRCTLFLGDIP